MSKLKWTVIFLQLILCGALFSAFKPKKQVTKEMAIRLAEQFIIDNGYTNQPADTSKLSYEILDIRHEGYIDSVLKHRKNTLSPKAFCISESSDRWDVGFLSANIDLSTLNSWQRQTNLPGRAVIVMKHKDEISIAHRQPLFSLFEKL